MDVDAWEEILNDVISVHWLTMGAQCAALHSIARWFDREMAVAECKHTSTLLPPWVGRDILSIDLYDIRLPTPTGPMGSPWSRQGVHPFPGFCLSNSCVSFYLASLALDIYLQACVYT